MEREKLTRMLDEPGAISPEDLRALKDMAQRFPWFSGAQLLHAAGERQSGQVLSDETLRVAAAHLPSRSALFDLAVDPAPRKSAPLRVVRIEAPVAVPEPPVPVAPTNSDSEAARTAMEESERQAPIANGEAATEMPSAGEQPESARTAESDTSPAPERVEELDDQIMKAALASAYDLTWKETIAPPSPMAPEATPAPPAADPPPTRTATGAARLRFSEWLEEAGTGPAQAASSAPPPESEKQPAKAIAKTEALDAKALIDRFIQHEPPAIPPKPAFFTPQQAAKKSLDDSSGIVTETLARIYEQQGNTAKAIEAYRRLALKYPEKSSYFAALSKALEEKLTP